MTSTITIYGAYLSPPCRAVWYTAGLGGIELNHVLASVIGKPDELFEHNPLGQFPTIKEGDFALSQGNAICRYLDATHQLGLVPDDARERAKMDQYLDWAAIDFARALGAVIGAEFFMKALGNAEPAPEEKARRWKELHRQLDFLDGYLAGRQWLVGDAMTLADIRAYACCSQLTIMGLPFESANWANVDPWVKALEGDARFARVNEKGVAFYRELGERLAQTKR